MAAKKALELENQDRQFQDEYTSGSISTYSQLTLYLENLEGLRVGHDFGDIEEGEGVILTIKDGGVLDEDGNLNFCFLADFACRRQRRTNFYCFSGETMVEGKFGQQDSETQI